MKFAFIAERHPVLICEPGTAPVRLARTAFSRKPANRGVIDLDHAVIRDCGLDFRNGMDRT